MKILLVVVVARVVVVAGGFEFLHELYSTCRLAKAEIATFTSLAMHAIDELAASAIMLSD